MDDLRNIHYSHIIEYNYSKWFHGIHYNGKNLNDGERNELIQMIDEDLEETAKGLPLCEEGLSIGFELQRIACNTIMFVTITRCDCLTACKLFLSEESDYGRRFMRGKLKVILNEGFKNLYGFNEALKKKSIWYGLLPYIGQFPERINRQYQDLSFLLEEHSKRSSWWKDERDYETHLDIVKLYESRKEDIDESKVMMESLQLYEALLAVNCFLENAHTCIYNFLVDKYKKGELREE